jgi:phage regulator Rha-like protein
VTVDSHRDHAGGFCFGEKMELATLTTLDGMDSRDIATLTGKNHADVCRDVRVMLEGIGLGESKFASSYTTAQNKRAACYLLPKRECIILASGYNVKLRAAITDRWTELETKQMPRSFAEALRLAADQADKIESLSIELDRSKEYASIKRIEKVTGKRYSWRKLKAQGHEMGIESKEVFDANYGTVKAYRADVWMESYGVTI